MQTIFPHHNTRAIIEAWADMRKNGLSDGQSPQVNDYPGLMDRLFVLRRTLADRFVFRKVGRIVSDLVGLSKSDVDFLSIWRVADRILIRRCLAATLVSQGPLLIRASASDMFPVEIMLAPLDRPDQAGCRFLGHYQGLGQIDVRTTVSHHAVAEFQILPVRTRTRLHLVR